MSEATRAKLLTIEELAGRWGLDVGKAKERIRARKVPFVNLGDPGKRIWWSLVRFRVEDVEAFEAGGRDTLPQRPEPEPDRTAPASTKAKRGRPSVLWG